MAIVPLHKMTLYGAESQQDLVIERLQELGCVHLIRLGPEAADDALGETTSDARIALRYLRACPERRRQVLRTTKFDRQQVISQALQLQRESEALDDQRDQLLEAIAALRPWGEFQLPASGKLGDVQFHFYIVPLGAMQQLADIALPWREISRDPENAYVLVCSCAEPTDVPGKLVTLDPRPLSQLESSLEDTEEQREELHHRRVGLTRWCRLLQSTLDAADDETARHWAARQTFRHSKLYALQGWIPRDASDSLRQFAAGHNLAITIEPPDPADEPPTLLHHPAPLAGSESLVTFYKMPDYRSWDPSLCASLSFAIFFAMILADAGYGLVLALLLATFWKKLGTTASGRRSRNVLLTVVGCTLVYGLLCGSYFGLTPPADSAWAKLQLLDAQAQSLMMPLTILIGVIHLSLAHLVSAWLQRQQTTALASLGWVAVMAGATLFAAAHFTDNGPLAGRAGMGLLVGGLLAVFLFSSQRPFFSPKPQDQLLRVVEGLRGLTGLSGLFGDVLSYLRLFALGLSSAKLSQTFNNLGASAWDEAGLGVVAAIGIVLFGHTLNLVLSIMSGVVHGLRLNCIEFFKYSLPDEGYRFETFAKKAR